MSFIADDDLDDQIKALSSFSIGSISHATIKHVEKHFETMQ